MEGADHVAPYRMYPEDLKPMDGLTLELERPILERYEGDVGISIWERIKTCFTNCT